MGTTKRKKDSGHAGRVARVAGLAPSAVIVRRVFRDPEVRVATNRVLDRAVVLSRDLSGKEGKLGKLSRDERLRKDLAKLIRAMAEVLDVQTPHRARGRLSRPRPRIAGYALAGATTAGGLAWLARRSHHR
ncbi:MAG: hypothetical protein GXX79_10415 [Actinomycetales bacterium]|nr:hypothetical protein [Actinomycetales bacterium]